MSIAPGERFGRYQIEARLGRGGMGEVYRAFDTRLGRLVAVKVLTAGIAADEVTRIRFEHEARTISRLDHPHICTLYDVGETDGQPYLVMQYIEGETLADYASRRPLPFADVVRIGTELASALGYAHRSGVLHRDIKPGNIMRLADGRTIVLDFGIAKAAAPSADATTEAFVAPLTVAGGVIGTVEYMSPEQLGGAPLDPRSDIFSLGLVLYELASGRHPFRRQTTALTASAILTAPYPHLAATDAARLDAIFEKMLAKSPGDRYQAMSDVLADLTALQSAAPPAAAAILPRAPRPLSRRGAALAAIAFAAMLGVAVWGTFWRAPAASGTLESAPTPLARSRLTYWLEAEPPVQPGATPTAFPSLGDVVFPANTRFRVHVLPAQDGHLALVADEAPGRGPATGLTLLALQPARAGTPATTGWYRLAGPAAVDHLWLVWSRTAPGELAPLAPLLNPRDAGLVEDQQAARAVRALLERGTREPPSETRDPGAVRATLESTADLLVRRLELHHE